VNSPQATLLDSCYFIRLFGAKPRLQKALRYHQHAPGSAVPKDAAHLPLKFDGTPAKLGAELTGKRSQTAIANLEAYFRYGALRGQHLLGAIQTQAGQKIMRRFAKGGPEKPMEMEFGKTGLTCRLLQQYARLVSRSEQVASPTESAESVVMEQLQHAKKNGGDDETRTRDLCRDPPTF
jgi:hypothetical protein